MHYANLINANDQLKPMISELCIKLTTGCYSLPPLKESRPEIQDKRLSREEKHIKHQKQQGAATLEKIEVVGGSHCG